jgi:cytochrome c553
LLLVVGCGHTQEAARTQPELPPTAAPEPVVAPSPPKAAATDAAVSSDAALQGGEGSEPITSFMLEHFMITAWVRDAIVDGNLERIRTPLRALAAYEYQTVAPGGWMQGISQLQAAARVTAEAHNLSAAASGIAGMARVCGDCHRAQGGPTVQHYRPDKKTPKSDKMEGRMYRHAWAAERLWEGLTAPSDNAWEAGAAALSHAPVAVPKAKPALPAGVAEGLTLVRQLGVRAEGAESSEQRAEIYGQLLTTCATCHAYKAELEF